MAQIEAQNILKERLFFIDVIRLLSMLAIIHFHLLEASFYQDAHALGFHSLLEAGHEYFSRFMAFSGFSIVIISYFLIGFKRLSPKKMGKILVIAIGGATVLFAVYQENGQINLEWDIYAYIAVVSCFIFLIRKSMALLALFSALGLIAILLPPETWHWPAFRDSFYYNALLGDYESYGKGGWPLIPWFGFPVLFFTLGRLLRDHPEWSKKLKIIGKKETVVWLAFFAIAAPFWGAFLPVPVGPGFAKFVNNRPRIELFSHLLILFFCMRLGFVEMINRFVARKYYLSWISRLYVNQKFFMFYIVQWILIGFLSQWSDLFLQQPLYYDLALFAVFPLAELACYLLLTTPKKIGNSSFFTGLLPADKNLRP